jgi:hypothetical protein
MISVQAHRPNTTDHTEVILLQQRPGDMHYTCQYMDNSVYPELNKSSKCQPVPFLNNLLCSMVLNFVQSSLALLVQTALQDKGADSLLQSQLLLGTGATAHI